MKAINVKFALLPSSVPTRFLFLEKYTPLPGVKPPSVVLHFRGISPCVLIIGANLRPELGAKRKLRKEVNGSEALRQMEVHFCKFMKMGQKLGTKVGTTFCF